MDISSRVHGKYRLPIGAVLSLLPLVSYSRARVTAVTPGLDPAGPWELNGSDNGTLTIGPFAVPAELNVETLDGDVGVDVTRKWVTPELLGGDDSVDALSALALGNQTHQHGFTVGWFAASRTGGRDNNFYGIPSPSSYQRINGRVTVNSARFDWCHKGRKVKVAFAQRSELMAWGVVVSFTHLDANTTQVVLDELFTPEPRPDIALGSVTDGTGLLHDLQSGANCHPEQTMLNVMCEGNLRIFNFAISGATTSTWSNPGLQSYVLGMPRFDLVIFELDGNDLTFPTRSMAAIFASCEPLIKFFLSRGRTGVLMLAAGAREGFDFDPSDPDYLPNPELTPDFTTFILGNAWQREKLAARHPNLRVVDGAMRVLRASLYGDENTDDILHGLMPEPFLDNKDIHGTPWLGYESASADFEQIADLVRPYCPLSYTRPDCYYLAPQGDIGGMTNPHATAGWFGAVPTTPVVIPGLNLTIGTGVAGMTGGGHGFTSKMDGYVKVRNGDDCREVRFAFNDPEDGGATLVLEWRGFVDTDADGNPVDLTYLRMLNDARWRGVDLSLLWKFGFWGFKQIGLLRVTAGLFGVAGGQEIGLCAAYSDTGIQGMQGGHRTWGKGISGQHRGANNTFRLPTPDVVFTDAFFRLQFDGNPLTGPAYPMGKLRGFVQAPIIRADFDLAPALPGSWS